MSKQYSSAEKEKILKDIFPDIEKDRLTEKVTLSAEEHPGVLVSSEIIKGIINDDLISLPWDKPQKVKEKLVKCLKPAAFHLCLGNECRIGADKPIFLDEKKPYLEIPPYQVVIVKTEEKLNMPKNLIARWNLSISQVYKGLLWVGGPQVDPGYEGHLFCPLYNLSPKPVILQYGEPFATIDFIRTTPGNSVRFQKKRFTLADYGFMESAPKQTIDEFRKARRKMDAFEATTLTVMGILITALAIISTSFAVNIQLWPALIWILIAAVVTFLSGFFIGRVTRKGTE